MEGLTRKLHGRGMSDASNQVPTVTFHGAAQTVTGSCYEVIVGKTHVLVDCGMFQGSRSLESLNREPFAFSVTDLTGVLLTHAHLDHSGLLPKLVAHGFKGRIWCTGATADLLPIMLEDAAHIEEGYVTRRNRRPDRADEPPMEPTFTVGDARAACELVVPVALEQWLDVAPGIRARFWNAGHILGSASVEIKAAESRLLFSGDLGPDNKSFQLDPIGPRGIDHLFCESTYGDRRRDPIDASERLRLLATEAREALRKGGNLVIPVFALERTQELLLDFARLIESDELPSAQLFIDSPLAIKATEVFARHICQLEDVPSTALFRHPSFHYVQTVEESVRLNSVSGAIILAASGMCEGGRVRFHLVRNLPRSDSTVLFVGYQAQGTLGRTISQGARRVRISGQDVAVRATIRRLDCYSAHADQRELENWAKARKPVAGTLFLTHGEQSASEALRVRLDRDFSDIVLPEIGEQFALAPGEAARRIRTGRVELREAVGTDWQNDYADYVANLKRSLERIESVAARRKAISKMRGMVESLAQRPKG